MIPGSSTSIEQGFQMTGRVRAPYFKVRASKIQGKGAFAVRRIRKGTRIIEYLGERITQEEADARYDDDGNSRTHVVLFAVDGGMVIDAAVGGNEAQYINHSCAPNCQAFEDDGRIFIEALRTIQPGEELAYDYQFERHEGVDAEMERRYPCHCGAEGCRGTLFAPSKKTRKRG